MIDSLNTYDIGGQLVNIGNVVEFIKVQASSPGFKILDKPQSDTAVAHKVSIMIRQGLPNQSSLLQPVGLVCQAMTLIK